MSEVIKSLSEEEKTQIESAFSSRDAEKVLLKEQYAAILNMEPSKESCDMAGKLLTRYVSYRTGVTAVHKAQKNFFLKAGQLCDALKSYRLTETAPDEAYLNEFKNYFAIQEALRRKELHDARRLTVTPYVAPDFNLDLGDMEEDVWSTWLAGKKLLFEQEQIALKEQQEKLAALAVLEKTLSERRQVLNGYQFLYVHPTPLTLESTEEEYQGVLSICLGKKADNDTKLKELAEIKAAVAIPALTPPTTKISSKKQIALWIEGMQIATPPVDNVITKDILKKFEGFKKWALEQ